MLRYQACISWGKDENLISTNYRQPLWTLPAKTLWSSTLPTSTTMFQRLLHFRKCSWWCLSWWLWKGGKKAIWRFIPYKPYVLCSSLASHSLRQDKFKSFCLRKAPKNTWVDQESRGALVTTKQQSVSQVSTTEWQREEQYTWQLSIIRLLTQL